MASLGQLRRPLIAAHRGLSSLYPENSIQGFKAALQWADFVEMDVVLCKGNGIIVCHDPFLSKVSNIEEHPEFQDRKKVRRYYGEDKFDWWISDFDLEELRTLRIRQCILSRQSKHDYAYTLPTLHETLSELIHYNRANQTQKGVLLELKDEVYHQEYCNARIGKEVMELLSSLNLDTREKCEKVLPIVLMAFDAPILKYLKDHTDLPRSFLMWSEDKNLPNLEDVREYADIVGIDIKLLWSEKEQKPTNMALKAKELNFPLHGWTFQDDSEEIWKLFQSTDPQQIFEKCRFLDGFITEFPQSVHE